LIGRWFQEVEVKKRGEGEREKRKASGRNGIEATAVALWASPENRRLEGLPTSLHRWLRVPQ
jgi:hypothetical protein